MDKNSIKPLEDLLDSVREIDGFPIAEDEDILALSDPPFYTACPNPYIEEFIEEYGTPYDAENDDYHREPFVGDISEGKNDKLYRAHSYHTKVPHKAIKQFIEHYTNPGDIVFDGFCGSGMTGLAAQMTNRKAIISDLSPAATFISYNYNNNSKKNIPDLKKEIEKIINQLNEELSWLYETYHHSNSNQTLSYDKLPKGRINYVIWSDILICPYCDSEYVFWDAAVDKDSEKVLDEYSCTECEAILKKRECKPSKISFYDSALDSNITQKKTFPAIIDYSINRKRFRKSPDDYDLKIIDKISKMEIPYWYPNKRMPEGDESRRNDKFGVLSAHHFYNKRALWIHSAINKLIKSPLAQFVHTSLLSMRCTNRMPYRPGGRSAGTVNNLYLPSLVQEYNVIDTFKRKSNQIIKAFEEKKSTGTFLISTNSATKLKIKNNSVDYIFTDPPFGSNIMYSEISVLWEAWLKVFTNNNREAIINKIQKKQLPEYTHLMTESFKEMYRILKPNRWITIEFHNSKASVWNGIQESITRAGFIIAQVSILDKKQGSFTQVTTSGSVKNDLIINAYKPKEEFSKRFIINSGEGMEVDFIKEQLEHVRIRPNIERTEQMLYSKMLAHYVENGFKVKYNSTNFHTLLFDNFTELDGYWFLDNQFKEYNEWKSGLNLDTLSKMLDGQQVLLVNDEKTALTWIYHFLKDPKDYSEIFSAYQQVATTSDDEIPELRKILDNNFIIENGKYRRPLNQQEKEEINKNREKELDRAFEKLLNQSKTQKGKIKNIRREAMVHGFTKCYQEGRYQDILTIADKLYASTLESSGDIMDFIDIARIKTSGDE